MLGLVSTSANKIAARYRASCAAAGVSVGGGGAGAGRIGPRRGLDGCQVDGGALILQNQGLSGARIGRVASPLVASTGLCLRIQGLAYAGRLIASYQTCHRARVPAAAGRDREAHAAGGRAPQGGPASRLTPGCARRRSPANRAASPALGGLKAFGPLKNREEFSAAHGVGGCCTPEIGRCAPFKRLNRPAKSRPECCTSGRGETKAARLLSGKAASVCGGWNRVN